MAEPLSAKEIHTLARAAGFSAEREEAVIATAVALAESGGNPLAHNDTPPDDSFGLWQINMLGDLGPDRRRRLGLSRNDELFDPPTNARAARLVFLDKGDFTPWTMFKNGGFKRHLDAARGAAASFVAGVQPGADLTEEELLDALESPRGQRILAAAVSKAVRHELRVATGPDDASVAAGIWFDGVRADLRAIRLKLERPPA
jgi:Lysozyme like domain